MDEGAIAPDAAKPLPDLSPVERRGLARLRELGAVQEAAPGAYWLDHERLSEYRHHRRIVILAVIAVLIALFFVVELGRP